ncbi:MAG: (2Fe-2S)-binding protein [Ignavibacteriae bacterium]|nr:(2Fe-2S)-binding protein [Ignavibacteriota bacterium]MCB9242078.1 (2Fe-2S)-binding protein [Ignavibacteriales bacterium]
MPKFTLDDREIEFNPGDTIIKAAKDSGITLPNFCWHPGLSVSGNCRICLVDIEGTPKLSIACATQAAEGMVVHSTNEKAIHAQNAVMEFLLINHPLDCPICDEAGECKLQDYAYKYGVGYSRYDEEKNHKDKRVDLGPNIMFDQERCISCSRCIRFCDEVAKSPQLTFVQRGEKVTIETFPGEELDNPYSMNVIEICPVGALTSKDFRFKSRVWEMSFTDSVCPGCSRGCNSIIGVRNNQILRIEPRENMDVNEYWLCDWGRLNTYKWVNNSDERIDEPQIKLSESESNSGEDRQIQVSWDEAISKAVNELKNYSADEILFVASPFSTLEDNYTLKKLAKDVVGTENIVYIPHIDGSFGDDLLRKSDMTPNSAGLKLLAIRELNDKDLADLQSGKYKLLYVLNDDAMRMPGAENYIHNIQTSIQHIQRRNNYTDQANVLFSDSCYAEINGTFVNFQKRVQRIRPAVTTLDQERLIGEYSVSRWDKFGAHNDRWTHGKKFNARPAWKVIKNIASVMGHSFSFDDSEEVFMELSNSIAGMEGYDYETVGSHGIVVGEKPMVTAE